MMLGRVRPQYVINIVDDRNRARTKLSPRPPGESREINKNPSCVPDTRTKPLLRSWRALVSYSAGHYKDH